MDSANFSAAKLHERVPPDWYETSVRDNLLQRYWHSRRISEVGKYSEPVAGEILDIGSADGYFTKRLLDFTRARKVIGIDVLQSSVAYANRRYKKNKSLVFRVADAQKLNFTSGRFAAVYILEALEHIPDARHVMNQIYRILRPGGFVLVLVPSENWLFKLGWPVWLKTRGKIWNETHLNFFSGSKLPDLMHACGFADIRIHTFILGMLLLIKARKPK